MGSKVSAWQALSERNLCLFGVYLNKYMNQVKQINILFPNNNIDIDWLIDWIEFYAGVDNISAM